MAVYTAWLKDLLAYTPSASRPTVKRELQLAMREFYRESKAWRILLPAQNVTANTIYHTANAVEPSVYEVYQVLGVFINGLPINPLAAEPVDSDTASAEVPAAFFVQTGYPTSIGLYPKPRNTLTGKMRMWAAVIPASAATSLHNIATQDHYMAILDGTLGRLYAQPAKPYSDPTRAAYHMKRFRAAIGKYAAIAKQGNNGAQAWRFPPFAK
jgi:hypothetical protein